MSRESPSPKRPGLPERLIAALDSPEGDGSSACVLLHWKLEAQHRVLQATFYPNQEKGRIPGPGAKRTAGDRTGPEGAGKQSKDTLNTECILYQLRFSICFPFYKLLPVNIFPSYLERMEMPKFTFDYKPSLGSGSVFEFDSKDDFAALEFAKGFLAGVGHALGGTQTPISGALSADGDPTPFATYCSEASDNGQAKGWNFRLRPSSVRFSSSDMSVGDPHDREPGKLSEGGARPGKLRKQSPAARRK